MKAYDSRSRTPTDHARRPRRRRRRSPRRTTRGRPARARAPCRPGRSSRASSTRTARPSSSCSTRGRRSSTASRAASAARPPPCCARRTGSTRTRACSPRAGTTRASASSTSTTRATSSRSATGSRQGTFWGAYYAPTDPKREIVYGLDVTSGIDVLQDRPHAERDRGRADPEALDVGRELQPGQAERDVRLRLPAAAQHRPQPQLTQSVRVSSSVRSSTTPPPSAKRSPSGVQLDGAPGREHAVEDVGEDVGVGLAAVAVLEDVAR